MQFSCESCKAQLQIADEKVRGKRLLVRCKRCGAKIGISDPALGAPKTGPVRIAPAAAAPRSAPAPQAPPSSPPAAAPAPKRRDSDTESTRAMDSDLLEQALQASKAEDAPAPRREPARERVRAPVPAPTPAPVPAPEPAPARDPPVWFAMVHGKQTGPVTRAELAAQVDDGAVGPRTYLWKDGMGAWQRAREIPELQALFPGFPDPAAPAQQAPAPPSRAVREFTAADLAAPAPASVPALELETPVGGIEKHAPLNGDLGAFDPAPASPRTDPEGVANELFTPESGEVPKSAADLAGWATAELQKKPAPAPRPRVHRASFNFEGATPRQSGLPLAMIGVVAVLALVAGALWFFLGSGPAPKPPEQKQKAASAAPAPATPEAPPQQRAKDAPAAKPEPPATGLTADQVRKKLDENKGALQGCIDEALRRDPNLRVGKIHIATRIAPSGEVTTAKIDKGSVEQSPLGACLRKATRRIAFPPFSGDSFDVDVPIVVTAGD